jgi:hypothetical protein
LAEQVALHAWRAGESGWRRAGLITEEGYEAGRLGFGSAKSPDSQRNKPYSPKFNTVLT